MTGTAPRAAMASTSAAAACWYLPTVAVSDDVEHVELVVRDASTLGRRQLGGADVHAAVQLHRVGVDDLAADPFGDVERQGALAGAGRPDDGDGADGDHGVQTPTKYPTPYGAPRNSSRAAAGRGSVSPARTW